MRSSIVVFVFAAVLLANGLMGQTTGIPGLNDFTVTCAGCGTGSFPACWGPGPSGGTGGVSGSTSCTTLYFDVSAGGTFTLAVTALPGSTVTIFNNPCACSPCFLPLPPICGIPFTSCGNTTNLSVDLNLSCGINILFSGGANTAGIYANTITIPPLPPGTCIQMGIQAAISGSISCAGPFIVSQAYTLRAAA
jgi:hypothetical protein